MIKYSFSDQQTISTRFMNSSVNAEHSMLLRYKINIIGDGIWKEKFPYT